MMREFTGRMGQDCREFVLFFYFNHLRDKRTSWSYWIDDQSKINK